MTGEFWRPVPTYEGYYEVSDRGRVRSVDRDITDKRGRTRRYWGKVLAGHDADMADNRIVTLSRHGQTRDYWINSLMDEAFLADRPDVVCPSCELRERRRAAGGVL